MKEPINPALVRVTGDDMVTGVITMKEALEREVDKMKPVYDAAMAMYEMAESGRIAIDSDVSDGEAARVCVEFDAVCRRAKENK